MLQEALDKKYYDERVPIPGAEGVKWAKALAQKEGIFTGISGVLPSAWRGRSPNARRPGR